MDFEAFLPASLTPVGILVAQVFLTGCIVAFASPRSFASFAALPPVTACSTAIVLNSNQYIRLWWASLLSGVSIWFLLQYIDLCFLCKHSPLHEYGRNAVSQLQRRGHASEKPSDASNHSTQTSLGLPTRVYQGLVRTLSFRNPSSPYEVKSVPHFSNRPGYVPSKWAYCIESTLKATVFYLFVDFCESQPPPEAPQTIFGPDRVPLLRRQVPLTQEEVQFRAVSTLFFWLNMYCMISCLYLVPSIVAVSLGASPVESWRPVYNSPYEAYNLQRFWGTFWHQIPRRTLSKPASIISRRVLRLPDGSLPSRYAKFLGAFALSGFLHAVSQTAGGLPMSQQGAVRFFSVQVLGIVIEDFVSTAYTRSFGKGGKGGPAAPIRFIGYCWVCLFLVWSTPCWMYPDAALGYKGPFLPFSVIKPLLKRQGA